MNLKKSRILIFSGPSGGHLFPAQAFAEAVQDAGFQTELFLVTSQRAKGLCSRFASGLFTEVIYLPEFGLPSSLSFSSIKLFFNLPVAIVQSWGLLLRFKPDLCLGFGSFVSYFGVLFASWRGIPTLIHEQNQAPGKATRMLRNKVGKIAVSFPQTAFKRAPGKLVFTGLPIRRDLRRGILPSAEKRSQKFTVLVCGGSQGSAFLNQTVLEAFYLFTPEERARFAVIHITGQGQEEKVKAGYQELEMQAEVYPFFQEMNLLYNRAHMAVSRAGANSSFEQALYGLPTVFIPYPHAEGHQAENARYFVEQKGAQAFRQDDQAAKGIAKVLRDWSKRGEGYQQASRNMLALAQNTGHALLLAEAEKIIGEKNAVRKS